MELTIIIVLASLTIWNIILQVQTCHLMKWQRITIEKHNGLVDSLNITDQAVFALVQESNERAKEQTENIH